jgi:hypothetical protein
MLNKSLSHGKGVTLVVLVLLSLALALSAAEAAPRFLQTNLVSDIPGRAKITDPDLVNPWGISSSPLPLSGFRIMAPVRRLFIILLHSG